MLLFVTSGLGGSGRTVTACNIAYRRAIQGGNVCYVDFDFGSPTAGAVFSIDELTHGTYGRGTHDYLQGFVNEPERHLVWAESDSEQLRVRPDGAGDLYLVPGDSDGGEFPGDESTIRRCVDLFLQLHSEFDLVIVDLSSGRSHATEIVMAATARPEMAAGYWRWLVFHRWTKQHLIAAHSLVHGERGLVDTGLAWQHHETRLRSSIRFVRTAIVIPDGPELAGLKATQVRWLGRIDADLLQTAARLHLGRMNLFGVVPLDPVLQWREQIITDADTSTLDIANQSTVDAFNELAKKTGEESFIPGLGGSL